MFRLATLAVGLMVVFAGCASTAVDETTTPTTDATPTETAVATDTATAAPRGTATTTAAPAPTATPTATPDVETPAVPVLNADDMAGLMGAFGIEVDFVDRAADPAAGYVMSYRTRQVTRNAVAGEMGTVAGVWAAFVDDHPDPGDRLLVRVTTGGSTTGYYYVKTEWAVAYNAGDMTANELGMRVLATLEVNDG